MLKASWLLPVISRRNARATASFQVGERFVARAGAQRGEKAKRGRSALV